MLISWIELNFFQKGIQTRHFVGFMRQSNECLILTQKRQNFHGEKCKDILQNLTYEFKQVHYRTIFQVLFLEFYMGKMRPNKSVKSLMPAVITFILYRKSRLLCMWGLLRNSRKNFWNISKGIIIFSKISRILIISHQSPFAY